MSSTTGSLRVLVTGTSSGFGHAAVQALAERGHTVYATMRGMDGKNREAAQRLRSFAEQGGHTVHVIELDVTSDASVQSGVTKALELGGGIDTLISNAGVGTLGLAETYTAAQLSAALDVNVVGAFRLARTVLPLMREAGAGHLVFVSSTVGRVLLPFMAHYSATKFALEAMVESLAFEVEPLGIDVTVIQPGAYGTDFMANTMPPGDPGRLEQYGVVKERFAGFGRMFQQMIEAGKLGDPREIAETFVRVAELPKGERPLRLTLDVQLGQAVTAINDTCAQTQEQVMAGMGFGKQ